MATTVIKQDTPADEIDLLALVERSLLFFGRYKWLFLLAIVLGIAAGILRHRAAPRVFKSRMIVHSFLLTNQEEIGIVNNWNELLKKREYGVLSAIFNMPASTLHSLKQLKAEELQKVFTPTNPNGFHIEVTVTDNTILPAVEQGIVYGFENTPFVKEKMASRRTNLAELISITSTEIGKLDSMKQQVERLLSGNGRTTSVIVDASGINRQLIEMNEKRLNLEQELRFANAVQVLQHFSAFSKPSGPRLIVSLFFGLLVFLALAYIIALIHSVNRQLKERARLRRSFS